MSKATTPPDDGMMLQERTETRNRWLCSNCSSILARTDESKEVLRIKYKDLYVFIEGGKVTVICRSCGAPNTAVQFPLANPTETQPVENVNSG